MRLSGADKAGDLYTSLFYKHHPQHSRQTAELQLRDITTVFSIRMQHHRILQPNLACAAVVYVKSADSRMLCRHEERQA